MALLNWNHATGVAQMAYTERLRNEVYAKNATSEHNRDNSQRMPKTATSTMIDMIKRCMQGCRC